MQKLKAKIKNPKIVRENKLITYKAIPIKLTADFSAKQNKNP